MMSGCYILVFFLHSSIFLPLSLSLSLSLSPSLLLLFFLPPLHPFLFPPSFPLRGPSVFSLLPSSLPSSSYLPPPLPSHSRLSLRGGQVRIELLSATMKLFFKRPPEVQKMLVRFFFSPFLFFFVVSHPHSYAPRDALVQVS